MNRRAAPHQWASTLIVLNSIVIVSVALGWSARLQSRVATLEQRSQNPPPSLPANRLVSDDELAEISQMVTEAEQREKAGVGHPEDVLRARQLLNRVKYLHGDLMREEWERANRTMDVEVLRYLNPNFRSGLGTMSEMVAA